MLGLVTNNTTCCTMDRTMKSQKIDAVERQKISLPGGDILEPVQKLNPEQILNLVVRKRWFLLIPFCLSLIAGIVYSIIVPRIYMAETLILVEPQRVPQNYIRSVVAGDIESRVSTIQQQISARAVQVCFYESATSTRPRL